MQHLKLNHCSYISLLNLQHILSIQVYQEFQSEDEAVKQYLLSDTLQFAITSAPQVLLYIMYLYSKVALDMCGQGFKHPTMPLGLKIQSYNDCTSMKSINHLVVNNRWVTRDSIWRFQYNDKNHKLLMLSFG